MPVERPAELPPDVAFMQGMIVHHAQALEMARLAPERSGSESLRTLARRIFETQEFEIEQMRRWLEERGRPVPDLHAPASAHAAHHADMAGMATPAQLDRLAQASGMAFDRLFLELMIRHHQGALVMVEELLSSGGGRDPETYMIVSHIDADQRAEIARMQDMLSSLQRGSE
ncbi:MAG: DUF305 domain-containing protein [Longimicrobiales bacterium]